MFKKRDSDSPYVKWLKDHPYFYKAFFLLTSLLAFATYIKDIDDVLTVLEKRLSPIFYDEALIFEFRGDKITYKGIGDSLENAILITGASSRNAGVQAEYYWLKKKLPDYQRISQSLINSEPRKVKLELYDSIDKKIIYMIDESEDSLRKYDVIRLKKGDDMKEVFFDITEFYDKPITDQFINQILSEIVTSHNLTKE